MATRKRQLRTANYSESARVRLADAVIKAREAAGYRWRTDFARAIQVSVRSLGALEQAEPTVGRSILFAVGRALPNWTEDTPRIILEGGPIPSAARPRRPLAEWTTPEAIDEAERLVRETGDDAEGLRFMRRWADAVKRASDAERDPHGVM